MVKKRKRGRRYSKRDPRSRRAVAIDKALQAQVVHPNTPKGRAAWSKDKAGSDLLGYDTSNKQRALARNNRMRSFKSPVELGPKDTFDWAGEFDSSLSHRENISELRRKHKDVLLGII